MTVSRKKFLHLVIEQDVANAQLIRETNISANIIAKANDGSIWHRTRLKVFTSPLIAGLMIFLNSQRMCRSKV